MPDVRLDELLWRWEQQRQQSVAPTEEELCRDCPELLPELRRRIRALEAMDAVLSPVPDTRDTPTGPHVPAGAVEIPQQPISNRSRYVPLRFHARGGLGEVLAARDEELGREVALKFIQQRHAGDADRRERFVREAQVTSRLEHPGVVPVYGFGQDDSDRPCYVMRFVRGATLQEEIARYHQAPPTDLAFRQLLSRFIGVCNTLAYAHSQGVLHRDIKPANIMLGPYGETLVLDWGLARFRDEPEGDGSATETTQPFGSGATRTGVAMGTPAYMSPEQAAGRWREVGPASDVYSLGATLYVVLTGRAPFAGNDPYGLLERVQRGDFPPPRQVKPEVPAALEAVCLKAMRRAPAERYGTALELAADLEHWLADEPVSARREPWTTRARRWLGRHRTLVTSVLATGAATLILLLVGVGLLAEANRKERELRAQADASFRQAREAVDVYFTRVSQSKLGTAPETQGLRKELFQTALTYYQQFLRQRGDDPELRAEVAETYRKVARISRELGTLAEALEWHAKGLTLCRRLLAEEPDNRRYRLMLAGHLREYSPDLRRANRLPDALAAAQEAVDLLEPLRASAAEDAETEDLLAGVYLNRGLILGSLFRNEEAIASSKKSLEVLEKALERRGRERQLRYQTAVAHNNIGADLQDLGRTTEALAAYRRARELLERVVKDDEANAARDYGRAVEARHMLASAQRNVGKQLENLKQLSEALPWYRQARDGWARLSRENPAVPEHRYFLEFVLIDLAYAHYQLGQYGPALAGYEEARGVAERLLANDPDNVRYLEQVAITWDGAGLALAGLDKRAESLRAFDTAFVHLQRLLKLAPDSPDTTYALSQHYWALGRVHRGWKDVAAAAAAVQRRREVSKSDAFLLCETALDFVHLMPLMGENAPERRRYADLAMDTLRSAVAAGYRDVEQLKTKTEWEPLRERPDFRALIVQLQQKPTGGP